MHLGFLQAGTWEKHAETNLMEALRVRLAVTGAMFVSGSELSPVLSPFNTRNRGNEFNRGAREAPETCTTLV